MKYYSTNNPDYKVSFKTAVMHGLAEDGGLFLPERLPLLGKNFFDNLSSSSFHDISFTVSKLFIENEIPDNILKKIIEDALNFDAPLVDLDDNSAVLELFHGPTLAFKDFGARFMARTLNYFIDKEDGELNILVATSGDTGSAVASGFYGIEGINVFVLYPGKKISEYQEKQITTLGKNIFPVEIEGTFDDCQKIVKEAFVNKTITNKKKLSSANSINIARLLPQSFYYIEAYKKAERNNREVIFSVPSGNLGNLTGGIIANKIGLPVNKFIAAVNSNSVFKEYLQTSDFKPRPSVKTLSNAMDVGNPSNFARIIDIFDNKYEAVKSSIVAESFNDEQTLNAIKNVYKKYNYVIDPHGAVGYLAYDKLVSNKEKVYTVILETAHPAKFSDTISEALDVKVEIPERLKVSLNKEKKTYELSNGFDDFKEFIINFK